MPTEETENPNGKVRSTEETENLKKQLREQYANDNEGYAKALKDNNIAVSDPNGKVRSIQEAYYGGGIDKSTRDYMMADAIAKFARNTGRDIGNIGAQFTGGTINNNYETPTWNDRNTELFKQQISSEAAGIKGSDKNVQRRQQDANAYGTELSNEKNEKVLEFSRKVKEMAAKERDKGNKKAATVLDYVASSAAGGNSNFADLITALAFKSDDPDEKKKKEKEEKEKVDNEIFNELKTLFPELPDERINKAVQENRSRLQDAYGDPLKQQEIMKEIEKKLKEESKAIRQFDDAVNYFTTNQSVINNYPTLRGFDPKKPTPKQIELLKNIAAGNNFLSDWWNEKEINYAKAYLTKMGLW
jgi:hypothetical protein